MKIKLRFTMFTFLISFAILGLGTYLNSVHGIDFPPNLHWFCAIATAVLWASALSSTLFILSMTFDRFYSIIRPHKAASFNTVKRAKITITFVIIISIIFNIPYLYAITYVESKLSGWSKWNMESILPLVKLCHTVCNSFCITSVHE